MQGQGGTAIGSATQLNLSGSDIKSLYRRLDSSGTSDWSASGAIYMVNGEFNNLAFHPHCHKALSSRAKSPDGVGDPFNGSTLCLWLRPAVSFVVSNTGSLGEDL